MTQFFRETYYFEFFCEKIPRATAICVINSKSIYVTDFYLPQIKQVFVQPLNYKQLKF
jgi:hypothetical protein